MPHTSPVSSSNSVFLSLGFRPFFLFGGCWAAFAMLTWLAFLLGAPLPPTAFDPVSWHAHEMLFGYLGAVLAGFLLTAVPNWTGRAPVRGRPLLALALLWLLARLAIGVSAHLPALLTAALDLSLALALAVYVTREILAGKNWRNLPVLALLVMWIVANAVFHAQADANQFAAGDSGFRLGLATAIVMIALIGGRIIPLFTKNWLVKQGAAKLPVLFGKADLAVIAVTIVALSAYVVTPESIGFATLSSIAAMANFWRMARWQGVQTLNEPLVWVLHAGFAFVPIGFLAIAISVFMQWPISAAQHLWMVGAIGVMTFAVMTRASLGHSGRPLKASRLTALLYISLIIAAVLRYGAGVITQPDHTIWTAAISWSVAFGGLVIAYWPVLTKPRIA